MRRFLLLLVPIALAAVLLACSSADDGDAGRSTTTSTAPTSSAPASSSTTSTSTSTTVTAPPPGCTASPAAVPPQLAVSGPIGDVDGDGRDDTGWVDERTRAERRMGIVTAAGGGSAVPVPSASPVPLSMFVFDADHRGGPEILASTGRSASLFTFADCRIEPVTDPRGQPYSFDLGFAGNGTGVGCATVSGRPSLVGLNVDSDDQTTVTWSRTVIDLDGTVASNGATDHGTFTRPTDGHAIDLLHTISCGDRTIAADGIHAQP